MVAAKSGLPGPIYGNSALCPKVCARAPARTVTSACDWRLSVRLSVLSCFTISVALDPHRPPRRKTTAFLADGGC
jgi:hypothetical protein